MDIKRQKKWLYAFSFVSCLRITDAVWVVLLTAHGFPLWQTGLAEGVFHCVSLVCEIPSGMAADLLGRRRALAMAGVLGAAGSLCMVFIPGLAGVLVCMGFSALSYNFISGTEEAIVYDSLLSCGAQDSYLKVNAACCQLENVGSALSDLASFLSAFMGFRGFYLTDAFICLGRSAAALRLREPIVTEQQAGRDAHPFADLGHRLREHVVVSARFLAGNHRAARLILADSALSLPAYLTLMYLQQRLSELGVPTMWLGVPILIVSLSRFIGTAAGSKAKPAGLLWMSAVCGGLIGLGTICAGAGGIYTAVAGACAASAAMDAWYLHVQKDLNEMYPSDRRATLVSVNSIVYSLMMIAVSPITGVIGDRAGSAGAGLVVLGLGILVLSALSAGALICRFVRRKRLERSQEI